MIPIRAAILLCLAAALGLAPGASANSGKGDEKGGAYVRIEPITVNLFDLSQYLQIALSAKGGSPEAAARLVERMPMVRHALILLLSSQHSEEILTPKGKTMLLDKLKKAINGAIKLDGHDGVEDVVMESFIVQ
ncbi:MAG: flagellar basal body-associated FliL family protein [Pseudomonadota bacterium]